MEPGEVLENGYTIKTTFWSDFTIAEHFGKSAILDTYKRAFNEWKSNVEYLTELCLILNWKGWHHYEKNDELSKLYIELWEKCDGWACDNLKGDDLQYFLETTD